MDIYPIINKGITNEAVDYMTKAVNRFDDEVLKVALSYVEDGGTVKEEEVKEALYDVCCRVSQNWIKL